MATDTLPQIDYFSPTFASVCRLVRVKGLAGKFFIHFERLPDAPTWLFSTASYSPDDGGNNPLTVAREWSMVTDANAANAEWKPTALAQYPWLPALVERFRPAF